MPVSVERIQELRNEAARQAGIARAEADRHRGLALAATDPSEKASYERGAASFDQLAAQHSAVATQRQSELVIAQQGLKELRDANQQAEREQVEAQRLADEQRAAEERLLKEEERRRVARLQAELDRYRASRDRTRSIDR